MSGTAQPQCAADPRCRRRRRPPPVLGCPSRLLLQVAYLVRSPYWRTHMEESPAVLCTQFADVEQREAACARWAVRAAAAAVDGWVVGGWM